jgi:hypothetical protein
VKLYAHNASLDDLQFRGLDLIPALFEKCVLDVMNKDAVNVLPCTDGTLLQATFCGGKDFKDKVNVLFRRLTSVPEPRMRQS